ncbi:IclR family transcriptional regulator [Natronococcus pandeyae]|uniref:IclR family transcriptional regulator n=1 Tax=Natronococcus pandeyae TaxID=2055836 RepID=A0A8J8Q653_9EURY|nr:IclR family transcriptional regulator [Natronococcus pandeyae]TYL37965.1 IclR family transcriptional regulator [Natronococcus pandeyae]
MNSAKHPIQAVQRTLDIVDVLREQREARVTDIADELDLSKGTIHCHLATLEQNGYVVKNGQRYALGLQFLDLAHHAKNRVDIYDITQAEVDALAAESGEMALFTVEEHGEGVCLYKAEGEDAVQTELYVGYRNGLYHTAVGKALLAFMPEERREEIIEETEFEQITPNTITDPDELREQLAEIRERGIAYNHEETIQGLVGVGAPIRDQDGTLYGAVSLIGPVSRMEDERLTEELPQLIRRAVNIIEVNITSL